MNLKKLLDEQRAIVEKAKAENRDMSAEEQKAFNDLQAKIDKIKNASEKDDATEAAAKEAAEAEKQRALKITELCREANLDPTSFISENKSIEDVKDAVIEQMKKDRGPVGAGVKVENDEEDKFRAAAADGLRMRAMQAEVKDVAEGASTFRGMSLKDMAVECLVREGTDAAKLRRMSADDLYSELCNKSYMNPSGAFPAILDTTIRKSIVQIYNETPTTFQLWTAKGSLSDFKESPDHEYVFGGLSDFEKVPENGEIKADVPQTELLPTRKLDTYGKQFSMTRQAFINDDIGFLAAVPGAYVSKAKDTIDNQVYSVLYNNGKIYDGKALFATDHKNLISTGSNPSVASFKEMMFQMGKQTNQFGDAISVTPQFLLIGNAVQFDVYTVLHSAQVPGSNNNDVNPFMNAGIQPIIVNKLDQLSGTNACPWFMVANQMSARSIQVDYLNGNEVPTIRRMEMPGVLGFVWDVYFDWGVAVRDFRGIYKNNGVANA